MTDKTRLRCKSCAHASKPFERRGALQRRCTHPKAPGRAFANGEGPKAPLCPVFESRPEWCPLAAKV